MDDGNYTPSALVNGLHGLPHYNLKFKPVSSTFNPESMDYLQALAQFGLPVWILAMMALIGLCCCVRKSAYEEAKKQKRARRWLLALALFAMLLIPICFWGNDQMTKGLDSFLDRVQGVQTAYDDIIQSSALIAANANATSVALAEAENLPQDAQDVEDLKAQLSSTAGFGERLEGFSGFLSFTSIVSTMRDFNTQRAQGTVLFLAGLLLLSFLSFLAVYSQKRKLATCARLLVGPVAFLALAVAGVYFMVAVAAADFCSEPNAVIAGFISPGDNAEASCADGAPDNGACIAMYFVNCPPNASSPFANLTSDAISAVDDSVGYLESLEQEYPGVNFTAVTDSFGALNTSLVALATGITCNPLHDEFVGGVAAICDDTLNGISMTMFTLMPIAILLGLTLWLLKQAPHEDSSAYSLLSGQPDGVSYGSAKDPLVKPYEPRDQF